MGSNLNFKNFGSDPSGEGGGGGGGRPPGNFPLTRQSSIYSLTFDEFQSTVGGSIGKDFGSMNMDELLKNIWSAEENQNLYASGGGGNQDGGGYLQRQGSLTLPRTLSQKTVDEVWRDMSKDYNGGKDLTGGIVGFSIPPRQPTLGEITLEEFLVRAGVVREEAQLAAKPNNAGIFGDFSQLNGSGLVFGFQQPQANMNSGLMPGRVSENNNPIPLQSANIPLSSAGVRSVGPPQPLQQWNQQQQQQQQLLPKQPILPFGAPLGIPNGGQLGSPGIRSGMVGISDAMNGNLVQNPGLNGNLVQNPALHSGGLGMVGLVPNGVTVASGSPAVSSDGLAKSNRDTSSVSPVPYVFNGSLRGRKSAALEKVVERRQRRMIKNRESAARSRARKQAYTMELEAEVAKLKEENEELQKRQEEMMELQKNQVLEMMNQQNGAKRRCLRRTQTGPW